MRTATNPETGEKVILVGSEWKPVEKTATNPSSGEKAYLVGGQWIGNFGTTPGGAATGNPSIMRQGDKIQRGETNLDPAYKVAGAGGMGGVLGAFSPEILTGLGLVAGSTPVTAPAAPFLLSAGSMLRGQRLAAAGAGIVSGLASESAGQIAEQSGAGPTSAEAARIVAGGVTPEFKSLAGYVAKRVAGTPVVSDLIDAFRKYVGKDTKLSVEQEKYLAEQTALLRGGPKSDAPIEAVGSALEEAANKGTVSAARATDTAKRNLGALGKVAPIPERDLSAIGADLRDTIRTRHADALRAREESYKQTEKIRDALVASREGRGDLVSRLPEYQQLVSDLKAELAPGKRLPSIQTGIKKLLSEVEDPSTSFQALDEFRRKLGDVFRGRPSEGYDAIGEGMARTLYERVSDIQRKYAGPAQEKLLDNYAAATQGLGVFRSKSGKRATALDSFDPAQFETDAAALPRNYFKTRASVQALKELTGNATQVNRSALEYANRELRDATGPEVRSWMAKNSDWLTDLPFVRGTIDAHAGKLEAAERSVRQAADFAQEAAKNRSLLMGSSFPAHRVKQLVESGNADMWRVAGPAIAESKQGRANVLSAVRQIVAEKPVSPEFFNRSIRPALEESRLADRESLDYIAARLTAIERMDLPKAETLGAMRRVVLQAMAGYGAGATARGAVEGAKMVPQ